MAIEQDGPLFVTPLQAFYSFKKQEEVKVPKYKSHKVVKAWKIKAIQRNPDDYGYLLILEETSLPFWVSDEYVAKHQPQVGGYFVIYEDRYKSYSPTKTFEEGYTRIEDE